MDVFSFLPITFTLQMESEQCLQEFQKFIAIFSSLSTSSLEETNQKYTSTALPASFKLIDKIRG
jgi:hypothetical protein